MENSRMDMEKSVFGIDKTDRGRYNGSMMNYDNICKFVPSVKERPSVIETVNFVLENSRVAEKEAIRSVYALHLVTGGTGVFLCDGKEYPVTKGDVFFTLPSSLYAIRSEGKMEYMYVSFLGVGAPVLLQRIFRSPGKKVFRGDDSLIAFWKRAIGKANPQNVDLLSRSVLEYSAACLISELPDEKKTEVIAKIEGYVRGHFTDCSLTLKFLADRFGYNDKYLSGLFYRTTGIRFTDYLTNLRINAACGLMQEGGSSVKEIAVACGFSDPLYFSKVFKRKMLVSPSSFMSRECADGPV